MELFGYFEGKSSSQELSVAETYNYGKITGHKYVGGIIRKDSE